MARCVALEDHHAAGVRPDIDDGDNVAAGRYRFVQACPALYQANVTSLQY